MTKRNLHVITGGPGSGKTTLLDELSRRGFHCVPEVARQITQEQIGLGGLALPWLDRARYAEIMLERSIASFVSSISLRGNDVCDRGIPDTLCYSRLVGLSDSEAVSASMNYRYAPKVFLAPPWRAIYVTDTERKQSFAEAVETSGLMARVYEECGYEVVEIPLSSPAERAEFILQEVGEQ